MRLGISGRALQKPDARRLKSCAMLPGGMRQGWECRPLRCPKAGWILAGMMFVFIPTVSLPVSPASMLVRANC